MRTNCATPGALRIAALGLIFALTSCTQPASPPTASTPAPQAARTVSDEIGFLLNGLLRDAANRPEVNALDTYAAAMHWEKNPPEFNALLNAKVGYHGLIDGHKVIIGGDGTNNVIGISVVEGFEPAKVVAAIRQAFTLKAAGDDESGGEKSEVYRMSDNGRPAGVVLITYGTAQAIRGAGTVGYMSPQKMKEMPGQ